MSILAPTRPLVPALLAQPPAELRYAVTLHRKKSRTADEPQALAVSALEMRDRYERLWAAGWRLRTLRGHASEQGQRYSAAWKRSWAAEVAVFGVERDELTRRSVILRRHGWELDRVNAHGSGADPSFTAVWRPAPLPREQVLDVPLATFASRHGTLSRQRWRLADLSVRTDHSGRSAYSAVWQPGSTPQIIAYGLEEPDFRAQYESRSSDGWRLEFLAPHLIDGRCRYTAVWSPSSRPEIQLPAATVAALTDQQRALAPAGWRVRLLQPFG